MKVHDGGRDSPRVQDMSWFKPENGPRLTAQLWRIEGTGTRRL